MLSRLYMLFLAFCQLCLAAEIVPRATFSEVTGFGANPTNTKMYLWVPNNLAPNPAIVVGIHWCSGNAQAYYQGSNWARLSETYGYIVIYPSTAYTASNCWDVSSQKTLTRGAGGNSDSIANMVKYVTAQYGADASRVFVTGISSGAMMTNVMAATYPDLFQAGIAYAGVPAGCFSVGTTEAGWNSTCANGQSITTPEHWAAIARAMAPGYTGRRPRMQVYHGDQDAVVFPQNYYETVKQWAGIFGYSTTPQQTISNFPRSPYNKYVFGPNLEGILGVGVSHSIDVFFDEDLKWFGITPQDPRDIDSRPYKHDKVDDHVNSGPASADHHRHPHYRRHDDSSADHYGLCASKALGPVRRPELERPNSLRKPLDLPGFHQCL
ncbi:PHB depolymerase family esterase [Verticillium dahliae]|nr:Protein adg3 [Verticillium dahliae VDG2]